MGFLSNMAFYPTLAYNMGRNYVSGQGWPWYSRIDERVVLGALPFKSTIDELIEKEDIGGIVCLNESFEMNHSFVADKEAWEARGVKFHWTPTPDFVCAPTLLQIEEAIEFIKSFDDSGKSVYVHCKAGRSRSATLAACYLVNRNNWNANTALQKVYHKRHQIILRAAHWQALQDYAAQCNNMPVEEKTVNAPPPSKTQKYSAC